MRQNYRSSFGTVFSAIQLIVNLLSPEKPINEVDSFFGFFHNCIPFYAAIVKKTGVLGGEIGDFLPL